MKLNRENLLKNAKGRGASLNVVVIRKFKLKGVLNLN